MARDAQDREDLLRDATAFVTRVQLRIGQRELFAGFRADGAASIYVDQDPVYHFNSVGQLRRAFVDDRLLKAEGGRLSSMTRQRTSSEVVMLRRELTEDEQHQLCKQLSDVACQTLQAIAEGEYTIEGQVADDESADVVEKLVAFLRTLDQIRVADSPHV